MECALTLMTISAGLLLSIACATLIEELFIGGLFRMFFAPRGERPAGPTRKQAKHEAMKHETKKHEPMKYKPIVPSGSRR
jgi:hypothetical protein